MIYVVKNVGVYKTATSAARAINHEATQGGAYTVPSSFFVGNITDNLRFLASEARRTGEAVVTEEWDLRVEIRA